MQFLAKTVLPPVGTTFQLVANTALPRCWEGVPTVIARMQIVAIAVLGRGLLATWYHACSFFAETVAARG